MQPNKIYINYETSIIKHGDSDSEAIICLVTKFKLSVIQLLNL